jgi:hypothetical protein
MLPVCAQADEAKHAFSAQLLLQLETDLLLSLATLQLTASIPDSHPAALAARDAACQLCNYDALHTLCSAASLHQVPRPAACTGPQVALQLLVSPFLTAESQQLAPVLSQQRRRHQQRRPHQQQLVEGCVLAPTAPLLTELLPLLTRLGLTQLQQEQGRQQERARQLQQGRQQQQEAASFPMEQPACTFTSTVHSCFKGLAVFLTFSRVPGPGAAAAEEASPPAAAAEPSAAAAALHGDLATTGSCVIHAQDAFLAHAGDIISFFEGAIRIEAALRDAANPATAGSSSGGTAAPAVEGDIAGVERFKGCSIGLSILCFDGYHPHQPGPLVLLGLAAGPGSQVQRQLHSLLATMVKLAGRGKGLIGSTAALHCRAAAGSAALMLLTSAAAHTHQQRAGPAAAAAGAAAADCSSGNAAAVSMLPSVAILGRCFLQWGEQLQAETTPPREPQQPSSTQQEQQHSANSMEMEHLMKYDFIALAPVLQQSLASGSTCNQLLAAGYVLQPVQQQLEQLVATCQILQDDSSDTAALLAAAQQLQSTGLALCSFAVPGMCNHLGCTSMAGLSELASVSRRSCICAGCLVARYCSRACQCAAWKKHSRVCRALSAAAAAAAAGAGAATVAAEAS